MMIVTIRRFLAIPSTVLISFRPSAPLARCGKKKKPLLLHKIEKK